MDYRTDPFEFKSSLGNFIFNVATTLGKMKVETGSLENAKYDYFRKIDEARYAGEAIAVVEAFIQEAERAIGETNTSVNPNMDRSNIFGTITPIPSHSLESPGSFTSTLRICRVISRI